MGYDHLKGAVGLAGYGGAAGQSNRSICGQDQRCARCCRVDYAGYCERIILGITVIGQHINDGGGAWNKDSCVVLGHRSIIYAIDGDSQGCGIGNSTNGIFDGIGESIGAGLSCLQCMCSRSICNIAVAAIAVELQMAISAC